MRRRWWGGTRWDVRDDSSGSRFPAAASGKVLSGLGQAPRRIAFVEVSNASRLEALVVGGLEGYFQYPSKKSKRLFHKRFESESTGHDMNGNDEVEVYYWRFACTSGVPPYVWFDPALEIMGFAMTNADVLYEKSVPIPKSPVVMSRLHLAGPGVSDEARFLPWPLNHYNAVSPGPSVGGGYQNGGRKVYLHSLKFGGWLSGTSNDDSLRQFSADKVRILIVFDLAPKKGVLNVGAPGLYNFPGYNDPSDDLFIPTIVGEATSGTNLAFIPQAQSRFRVLYDHVIEWKADCVLETVENPVSDLSFTSVINPDDVSTKIFDVSTSDTGSTAANSGVMQTGSAGSFQWADVSAIIAGTTAGFYPAVPPMTAVQPCTSETKFKGYDKLFQFSMTQKPAPPPDPPPPDVVVFANDGTITPAAPLSYFAKTYVQPYRLPFEGIIDLAKYGYYTCFDDDGMIISGALWMMCVSDAGSTRFGVPDEEVSHCGFNATTFYIDE